ncbi:MAG: metallophosphoesterase [Spirochaetaceae bacterium]|nr:metallophosphoesterase [Spirochaetaceae bacterium]
MNSLTQLASNLIGSQEDILALEEKSSANILVISDTHGDYDVLCDIIEEFGHISDALVFCGDGVCDICSYIQDSYVDESLQEHLPPVVAIAKGNGDSEKNQIIKPKTNELPASRKIITAPNSISFTVAGRNIFAVHGHRFSVDYGLENLSLAAQNLDADLVFFGHTHRPFRYEDSGTLYLNPGSCSRPRGGNPASFAFVSFPGMRERYDVSFFGIRSELFGRFSFYPINL